MVQSSYYCLSFSRILLIIFTIFFVGMIDLIWLYYAGISLDMGNLIEKTKGISPWLFFACLLGVVSRIPRYKDFTEKLFYNEIARAFVWLSIAALLTIVLAIFSYMCVALGGRLVDKELMSFDRYLGFDWISLYHWVNGHPVIRKLLNMVYNSGIWQLMTIIILLSILRKDDELFSFMQFFVISLILCSLISIAFPASSLFIIYNINGQNGIETVSDFELLREGSFNVLKLSKMQGLISFPSFHAMMAVGFFNAFRCIPVLFPIFSGINILMIASTPTEGAHYAVDVIVGIILAMLIYKFLEIFKSDKISN